MDDQAKIERTIKLLLLLSGNFGYKINQISEKLNVSERTVYRYIDTFKNIGFIIDRNDNGYWRIEKNNSQKKELHDLLQFSEEESFILQKAIHSINDNNLLKKGLVHKLYSLYNSKRVVDTIINNQNSEIISKLSKAITDKKQVEIIDYTSANSNTISNRIIEPIKFTTNFVSVWAYEIKHNTTKLFKTSRISKVEILNKLWENANKDKLGYIDCFRISDNKKIAIKLKLSMRARNLLIEEYPLAEKDIIKIDNNKYIFNSYVCNYEGVGRFVLGLMNEISIILPTYFKEYLNKRIKNKVF